MSLEEVRTLEEAGDVAGLLRVLKEPHLVFLGETTLTGESARAVLGNLPYSTVRIIDGDAPMVDTARDCRQAAAAALGRLGTQEALKGLIAALGDGSLSVVAAAFEALKPRMEAKGDFSLASDLGFELECGRRIEGMKLMEAQIALEKLFDIP